MKQNQKINYQRVLEQELEEVSKQKAVPRLLLHSCCAPCSSYVLEYLSEYMEITVFYYNPNIYPEQEYSMRVCEQQELIRKREWGHPIRLSRENMTQSGFMIWRAEWSRFPRAENGVFPAMRCGWKNAPGSQQKKSMIILRRRSVSAR